ncbi:hypothetical protein CR513_18457, partial [Mucuna pruriens]
MFNNQEILLSDVRYVLELKRNLISIIMFDNLGYTTQIEHGIMKISNNDFVIAKGIKINDGSTVIAQTVVASQGQLDKTRL